MNVTKFYQLFYSYTSTNVVVVPCSALYIAYTEYMLYNWKSLSNNGGIVLQIHNIFKTLFSAVFRSYEPGTKDNPIIICFDTKITRNPNNYPSLKDNCQGERFALHVQGREYYYMMGNTSYINAGAFAEDNQDNIVQALFIDSANNISVAHSTDGGYTSISLENGGDNLRATLEANTDSIHTVNNIMCAKQPWKKADLVLAYLAYGALGWAISTTVLSILLLELSKEQIFDEGIHIPVEPCSVTIVLGAVALFALIAFAIDKCAASSKLSKFALNSELDRYGIASSFVFRIAGAAAVAGTIMMTLELTDQLNTEISHYITYGVIGGAVFIAALVTGIEAIVRLNTQHNIEP